MQRNGQFLTNIYKTKKEIASDERTKSTIPRHESHSMQWVVCVISSGVLSPSHCHNLALFKLPVVPSGYGYQTVNTSWHLLCLLFSPCQKVLSSLISISKAEGGVLVGVGVGGYTWESSCPIKVLFQQVYEYKWSWEYRTYLGLCPPGALKPRGHAESTKNGGRGRIWE